MFTTRPEIKGTFGVIGTTHWLASAAGMAILEKGGNAFDAAVAAGFALQVVEPHLNGPGGEVPIITYSRAADRVEVICGQGGAPRGATLEHYRSLGLDLVPGSGLLATVIPGSFDAWMLLLRDHGTLRPRDVLAHAIEFAGGGYPLVPAICETIARVEDLFREEWPTSAALYLPHGRPPAPGTIFRNTVLAETYQRLVREGEAAGPDREAQIEACRKAWAEGFVAEEIERFCLGEEVMDTSGRRHRGVLTAADMAGWRAQVEAPVSYDYHGWRVYKSGAWGQGPVFLQQLALLKGFDLAAMDPLGPEFVHTITECAKLAFADREAFYGDPDFCEVPLERLLSEAYNEERRALVSESASFDLRPGEIEGYGGAIVMGQAPETEGAEARGGGEPTIQGGGGARGDTCHLDVIDRAGNMVSATPSGSWLQSSPIIPALGFCLNSRAQMFWLEDGLPASLAPGKRPRTTLSANLARHEDGAAMVFGTPGGDYQDQWTLTFFLRHIHHGMDLQQAIDAAMFQTDHMPSSFWPRQADPGSLFVEGRFPGHTIEDLRARGHRLEVVDDWSLGRLSAARRDGELLRAAANPRLMQGYAIGR